MTHENKVPSLDQNMQFYEVGIPPTASPDQLLALNALATTFGWTVKKGEQAPAEEIIYEKDFLDLSMAEYGSSTPGKSVINLLGAEKERFTGSAKVINFNGGKRIVWHSMQGRLHPPLDLSPSYIMDDRAFQEYVEAKIAEENPPFKVVLSNKIVAEEQPIGEPLHFAPRQLTHSTFETFVIGSNFNRHKFTQGSFAEMSDLILLAAGINYEGNVQNSTDELDFVSRAEVHNYFKQRMGVGAVERLEEKIGQALLEQLLTVGPTKHGELIAKGVLSPDYKRGVVEYETIARQSLRAIEGRYTANSAKAKDLLLEYSRS